MTADFDKEMKELAKHYDALVDRHGDGPEGAQYADRETQEKRMAVLCEIGVTKDSKVLDFGCGTGQLLSFLQKSMGYEGEYVGYDIASEAVEVARRTHDAGRFEVLNLLAEPVEERFDYVLVSGVFNNLLTDNRGYFESISEKLMAQADRGFAFNMLSRFVDYFDEGLYYEDPMYAFRFCKERLSSSVTLRHDYAIRPGAIPFEFTIYVHASEVVPRVLKRDGEELEK